MEEEMRPLLYGPLTVQGGSLENRRMFALYGPPVMDDEPNEQKKRKRKFSLFCIIVILLAPLAFLLFKGCQSSHTHLQPNVYGPLPVEEDTLGKQPVLNSDGPLLGPLLKEKRQADSFRRKRGALYGPRPIDKKDINPIPQKPDTNK